MGDPSDDVTRRTRLAIFVVSGRRQGAVEAALDRGEYEGISASWVTGFTVAGAVLGLGTLAAILANA